MKSFFLNSIIPVLILSVVINHFYQVKNHNLTPWKGGGMGMYSAIAWEYREVWFFGLPQHVNPFKGFEMEVDHARQYPADQVLLKLGKAVKKKYHTNEISVEVWEPYFSEKGTLSRIYLNGVDVP